MSEKRNSYYYMYVHFEYVSTALYNQLLFNKCLRNLATRQNNQWHSLLDDLSCLLICKAKKKKVAQRVTISHLSSMCQGEMWKRWRHHFPHYKSVGAFCCHGNQSFDPICPKTLCSLSPTPVMLHIRFDQEQPTGFRDIPSSKA